MIVSTYIIEYFHGDGGLVFWTAHILPLVSSYNWSKLYYFTSTGRQIGCDVMSPTRQFELNAKLLSYTSNFWFEIS